MNGTDKLCVAILQQTAKDYITAMRQNDRGKADYFEQWFRSDWGQLLSGDMGELIIAECRKRAKLGARPTRMANKVDYRRKGDCE